MSEKIKIGSSGNWGVKPNGLLGYNDENNIFKAIELSSSRASSGTYVAESGLIADAEVGVPRIDWTNGVGELLLEPQSTNLLLRSQEFTTIWSVTRGSVNLNAAVSPDGGTNADALVANTTADDHFVNQLITTSAGDQTFSCFIKQGGKSWARLWDTNVNVYVDFDVANGVVGTTSGTILDSSIIDYGNGWYRCSMSYNDATGGGRNFRIYSLEGDNDKTYAGDNITEEIYIYGAQVEQLSYPTSYIRTNGSSVTRIADAVTGNSSLGQVINSSEGVLYLDFNCDFEENGRIGLLNSSGSNGIILGTSTNQLFNRLRVSSSDLFTNFSSISLGSRYKVAFKFISGDLALWINGVEAFTDTDVFSFADLDTLIFSESGNPFYGRIRELKVYDTALTDAELTTLTTL